MDHLWYSLIGPPLTHHIYGDNSGAWCPATSDEDQTLELEFETSVYITQIKIYENYNGGAVTKIEGYTELWLWWPFRKIFSYRFLIFHFQLKALNGDRYEILWGRESPSVAQFYNVFSPSFSKTRFQSNRIRLTITQTNRNLFAEIEAVELLGSVINLEVPQKSLTDDITNLLRNS